MQLWSGLLALAVGLSLAELVVRKWKGVCPLTQRTNAARRGGELGTQVPAWSRAGRCAGGEAETRAESVKIEL
jgi:hypothetical protein